MISAKLLQIILVVIAGASVAIADALIKKTSIYTTSIVTAVKNPLMIWVILLYALQIILFSYVFIKKWDLGIVGLIQETVYAGLLIFIDISLFQGKISFLHGVGMAFAFLGILLMTI